VEVVETRVGTPYSVGSTNQESWSLVALPWQDHDQGDSPLLAVTIFARAAKTIEMFAASRRNYL